MTCTVCDKCHRIVPEGECHRVSMKWDNSKEEFDMCGECFNALFDVVKEHLLGIAKEVK